MLERPMYQVSFYFLFLKFGFQRAGSSAYLSITWWTESELYSLIYCTGWMMNLPVPSNITSQSRCRFHTRPFQMHQWLSNKTYFFIYLLALVCWMRFWSFPESTCASRYVFSICCVSKMSPADGGNKQHALKCKLPVTFVKMQMKSAFRVLWGFFVISLFMLMFHLTHGMVENRILKR